MAKYTHQINLLQKALDINCGKRILIEQQQFYSDQQKRFITMFVLFERTIDEETGRVTKREVLKTANQVDVLKYLSAVYAKCKEETL